MAKFCPNCGAEVPDGAAACPSCGAMQGGATVPQQQVVVNNPPAQSKSNGLAIAGFVVSLVSTILCCGSLNVISLVLSIVGAVKAKDYDGNGKGLAIAGIVISAIGLVILIIFTFMGYLASFAEAIENSTY